MTLTLYKHIQALRIRQILIQNARFMMKIKSSLFPITMCVVSSLSMQQSFASSKCNTKANVPKAVDQTYIAQDVRIFYTNNPNSDHALLDPKDINRNKVPDYIENIAIQATTTIEALNHLGFVHPLKSKRYIGDAAYIDIYVKSIDKNGRAFETPQYNPQAKHSSRSSCALSISLSPELEGFPNRWSVVSHEIFHLYQYGYAQFKNPWYLEGLTNWSERLIRAETGDKHLIPLPSTQAALKKEVYDVAYTPLWHRLGYLARHTNLAKTLPLPKELLQRRYIDGSPVFKDLEFNGYVFMRRFLENLHLASEKISQQQKLDPYDWSEKLQRNEKFSPIILRTIQKTMIELDMDKSKEEKDFLKLR